MSSPPCPPLRLGGPRPSGRAPGARNPRRILVIDDNVDAAESLRMLLALEGHAVEVANTGLAALGKARTFMPHIVICDIGLPDVDGYEVCRRLRREPGLTGMRLVALTGYGQESDQRRAREAGFHVHLTKPVDPAFLTRILAE